MSDPTRQLPSGPQADVVGSWHVSLAEIDAMGRKAAQGAGFSWGMAEEAGRAARWLAAYGLPGPETLAMVLEAVDGAVGRYAPRVEAPRWRSEAGPVCPIAAGAALSDRAEAIAGGARFDLAPVLSPLMVVPFLCRAARDLDCTIAMMGDRFRLAATPSGPACPAWSELPAGGDWGLSIACATTVPCRPLSAGSAARAVPVALWRTLDRFAQRTYVPASDVSRRVGAGAGLRDLD